MPDLTIAIGSTCSVPGDVAGNLEQIAAMALLAEAHGADLLLTPEMSASGYGSYPEVLVTAEPAGNGPVYRALSELATRHAVTVLAGFVERNGDHRHVAHYAVFPDGDFVVQRKHRVTPREAPLQASVELVFDDTDDIGNVLWGQADFAALDVGGIRAAIVICADLGVRGLDESLARASVQLLLLPTAAGGSRESMVTTADLADDGVALDRYVELASVGFFPDRAVRDCVRYRRAFAAVNMCGYDGRELYHGGSGSVIDPSGNIEAHIAGTPILDRQRPRFAAGTVHIPDRS
jgi:predicted amidohydrolase